MKGGGGVLGAGVNRGVVLTEGGGGGLTEGWYWGGG